MSTTITTGCATATGFPHPQPADPVFTAAAMQSYLNNTAMPNKGFVVVEVIFCYHQVLNLPFISQFLPNPMKIHTYTVMPLPPRSPPRAQNHYNSDITYAKQSFCTKK